MRLRPLSPQPAPAPARSCRGARTWERRAGRATLPCWWLQMATLTCSVGGLVVCGSRVPVVRQGLLDVDGLLCWPRLRMAVHLHVSRRSTQARAAGYSLCCGV